MDISNINSIAHAWASQERNEANRGKSVRSKGWVTQDQMRRDAAQKALVIMVVVAVVTTVTTLLLKIFGKTVGAIMIAILAVGLPVCYVIHDNTGCNVQWLPLWIVGFALLLKAFTKMFGRKWGLIVGIPLSLGICVGANVDKEEFAGLLPRKSEKTTGCGTSIKKVGIPEEVGISEKEKVPVAAVERPAAGEIKTKLNDLLAQVRANKNAPSCELDSRVVFLKKIFQKELLLSQFNYEAAYGKCVDCACRMRWIEPAEKTEFHQTNH